VCLGFIGEECGVHRDDPPMICAIEGRYYDVVCLYEIEAGNVCAVNDTETCEEVHIYAWRFVVTPSFSCRVVVSIALMLTMHGLREPSYIHDMKMHGDKYK